MWYRRIIIEEIDVTNSTGIDAEIVPDIPMDRELWLDEVGCCPATKTKGAK
jgi:hypothetical protein